MFPEQCIGSRVVNVVQTGECQSFVYHTMYDHSNVVMVYGLYTIISDRFQLYLNRDGKSFVTWSSLEIPVEC
jgi:hypothetical protein